MCCRKREPFQGPKVDVCLTLRSELSEETHVLTKQETLLGRGARVESSRIREPRRTALPCGSQPWVFMVMGLVLGCLWPVILTQNPCWWCRHCSVKMNVDKDSGRWLEIWCLLLTFPELFPLAVAY